MAAFGWMLRVAFFIMQDKGKVPTEPGYYWARNKTYKWNNLFVEVYGESPFLSCRGYCICDHKSVNITYDDITYWGPKVNESKELLVNINDRVKVILTKEGRDKYNALHGISDVKDDGGLTTTLWNLMRIFGGDCFNGGPCLFEGNRVVFLDKY